MATRVKSRAEVERQLAAVVAAQRIAGEEPTVEDMEAARRILMGEATTEQVIAEGLAELEAQYGFKR